MENKYKYKKKYKTRQRNESYDMYDDTKEDKKITKHKYSAQSYVLFLLARREYSVQELKTKLKEKDYSQEESNKAIEWAIESNYQSDERYATLRTRYRANGHGNYKIKMELENKGVSQVLIEQAIEEIQSEDERAYDLMIQYNNKKNLNLEWDIKTKEKAFRHFVNKGFSYDSIKYAWRKVFIDKQIED